MERLTRALWLLISALVACDDSEARREAEVLAAAEVVRARPDGTIHLSDADRKILDLEMVSAVEGILPNTRLRFGVVRARLRDEAVLVSPIAGRVRHLPAAVLGQHVDLDTPVFGVAPVLGTAERVNIGVQGADIRGQITALQGELTFREAEASRARELAGPKIISAAKLQEAETAVGTARARLAALQQARGQQVRGQSGEVVVTAPLAGNVVSVEVSVGALVHAGDVLARVLQPGPRWIDLAVEPGEPAGDAYAVQVAGRSLPARQLAVGAVVGPDGMRRDRIEVAEGGESLAPGAVVEVQVHRGDDRGIVLPASAVVATPAGSVVYVEIKPGVFAAKPVVVVARAGDRVRVTGALVAGEPVAARGVMGLHGETLRSALRQTE